MKTVKRILLSLLDLVMGLVIPLAGSIAIDFAVGTERINAVTNTTIPGHNGGPDVRAYVATPLSEDPFPVVIMQGAASQKPNPPQTYQDSLDWEYYLIVAYEHAFGTASHQHSHP